MPFLRLENVCKSYGEGRQTRVLANIDLEIAENEFVAVLGFSGSGKTTLISLIAGLEAPDQGRILVEGKPITGPGADRSVMFQNYSLLPWLSARGNIALAVSAVLKNLSPAERRDRVEMYLSMVGLAAAGDKKPRELSGGMRQRVAVARALSTDPKILLLDEPLSALDALTRSSLQDEIARIWREERKTAIMVTNDVDEGILLADRVVVLTPGPGATVGREFKVALDRPRDKKALNHDPKFKALRNEIIQYLTSLSRTRRGAVPPPEPEPAAAADCVPCAAEPAILRP